MDVTVNSAEALIVAGVELVSVAIEADIVVVQVSCILGGVMQSPLRCLPLVVASMAARTVVEGQKDSERSTSGGSGSFMRTTAVFFQVHNRVRWRAAEPLEQLWAFSGDALLHWRAVFAKQWMRSCLAFIQILECSFIRLTWGDESSIVRHPLAHSHVSYFGRRRNVGSRFQPAGLSDCVPSDSNTTCKSFSS